MRKKDINQVLNKAERLREKRRKLLTEAEVLRTEGQKLFDALAKKTCPYKKGAIFRKRGSNVWAKMTGVASHDFHHGAPVAQYPEAPYLLECLRCTVKGETQKDKWIFIQGHTIGSEWVPVE